MIVYFRILNLTLVPSPEGEGGRAIYFQLTFVIKHFVIRMYFNRNMRHLTPL